MTTNFMFYDSFLQAIDQLPEDKRGEACYQFCRWGITDELPDNKYLAMFCLGVRASVHKYQGRGGARIGAGRPKKSEDSENQKNQKNQKNQNNQNTQTETETETESETKKEIHKEKTVAEIIKQAGDALSVRKSTDMIFVDSSFRLLNYPVFAPYIEQVTPAIIESVENWLRQTKNGQSVSVQFITKQFFNFANRQGRPIFKEQTGRK